MICNVVKAGNGGVMLASWANTIVICAVGLGLGAVGAVVNHLTPRALREAMDVGEGEGVFRGTRRRTEEQQEVLGRPEARPFRIAIMALYGLIAVLVLTVWLSPVELRWWELFLSIVAGAVLTALVFRLARSGRLVGASHSFLDPLAGMDLLGGRASEAPPQGNSTE